jgi:predicted GNAT superfamily acetyltransferase
MSASPASFRIRMIDEVEQVFLASAVLSEVWGGDRTGMPPNLLRALAHAGNYAAGIYDGERMVGASVGFFAPPAARSLHSHITGILPRYQGKGLGRMLKQHQREWALERGIEHITWTYDPLVARNAYLNLGVLGAHAVEYLVDHYGPMDDGVNRGDETDRILVDWALLEPPRPTPSPEDVVATVVVPDDIEAVRRDAPGDAEVWRRGVREELTAHLAAGLAIGGFDAAAGGYLLVRP